MKTNDYIKIGKKNALLMLKIFVVVILFFTFFSKSIIGWFTPRVDIAKVDSGVLLKVLRANGQVVPKNKINMYTDISSRVLSINVKVEDKVKKGELLMVLDKEPLEKSIESLTSDIQKNEIGLSNLRINRDNVLLRVGSSNISSLSRTLDKARQQMLSQQSLFDTGAISKDQLDQYKEELISAEESYKNALASKSKNDKLARNEIISYDNQIKEKLLTIEILKSRIEEEEVQLEACQVKAETSGIIKEIGYTQGMMTNNQKVMFVINNSSDGYQVEIDFLKEQAKFIDVKDKFTVTIDEIGKAVEGVVVEKIAADNPNFEKVVLDIKTSKVKGGESADAFMRKQYSKYDARVPRGAIHSSSLKDTVFLLIEEDSPFGKSYTVTSVEVLLGENDDRNVGIQNGVYPGQKVIVNSSRRLNDGDKVIINQ